MKILIDIDHNSEVLNYIQTNLKQMEGWFIDSNATFPNHWWNTFENKTPSYFQFDFHSKHFHWYAQLYTSLDVDPTIIYTLQDAENLLKFIQLNSDVFS